MSYPDTLYAAECSPAPASGPLKAQPNPMEPFSGPAREATQAVVKDFFDQFVDGIEHHQGASQHGKLHPCRNRIDQDAKGMPQNGTNEQKRANNRHNSTHQAHKPVF